MYKTTSSNDSYSYQSSSWNNSDSDESPFSVNSYNDKESSSNDSLSEEEFPSHGFYSDKESCSNDSDVGYSDKESSSNDSDSNEEFPSNDFYSDKESCLNDSYVDYSDKASSSNDSDSDEEFPSNDFYSDKESCSNDSDSDNMVDLYHYTSKANSKKITKSGVIKRSGGGQDAKFGDGVYFTDMPPEEGKDAIIKNNWDGMSKALAEKKMEAAIKVRMPKDEVKRHVTKDGRVVYRSFSDVNLSDYSYETEY